LILEKVRLEYWQKRGRFEIRLSFLDFQFLLKAPLVNIHDFLRGSDEKNENRESPEAGIFEKVLILFSCSSGNQTPSRPWNMPGWGEKRIHGIG
jgi:hypothetical protein